MPSTVFPRLPIKEKILLPLVQCGMGVGISAHRPARTVAAFRAVGTISSVDLRRHHVNLMRQTHKSRDKELITAACQIALEREIILAKTLAEGRDITAADIMRPVAEDAPAVQQVCANGAAAVVVSAGLPLDLPDVTANYPSEALIPFLSDLRDITVLLKKWLRKNGLPDEIVIENPQYATGHLRTPDQQSVSDRRFNFSAVLEGTRDLFKKPDLVGEQIPLIVAGGIHDFEQAQGLFACGAIAIQRGTPFAVTAEGDAHPSFKKILAEARACTLGFDCLHQRGGRDGIATPGEFCIDTQFAFALAGDVKRGICFRGSERPLFGDAIRAVKELPASFSNGGRPRLTDSPIGRGRPRGAYSVRASTPLRREKVVACGGFLEVSDSSNRY